MPDQESLDTPRHPIGVVADRTRLSQDVLRVWERRYQAVEPQRGASGQRLYSDSDIERLQLLGIATQGGRSIGQVVRLTTEALADLVREDEAARGTRSGDAVASVEEDFIMPAMNSVRALDGDALETLLRRAAAVSGMPSFLEGMVAPLLYHIGDEWQQGRLSPAQEHVATAIVERVLASSMRSLGAAPGGPKLVIATPVGERHEIGAILAAAAAATAGWRVTYLGADLPSADIADAALRTGAEAVAMSVVYLANRDATLAELLALRARLPSGVPLLVGGAATPALATSLDRPGIQVIGDLSALRISLYAVTEAGAGLD
jgi:DNA-binding transcriptional MerR regulator/methylmalonyl-CoA mutase cobalamin-binding subunit